MFNTPQINPDMNLDAPIKQYSFADLMDAGVTPVAEVNDSWTLLSKESLVGVPFLVMEWDKHQGKGIDREYINVRIITKTNERFCFNDGGVGIRPTLERWWPFDVEAQQPPLWCPQGLRLSQYVNKDGIEGETYYFA